MTRRRNIGDVQVNRLLLRSASVTKDSALAASCDEPLAAGRVGRTPRGGSTHLVTAATVTTGAKPHGQLQLARNLEVERAVIGQRCRPQRFGEVQRCYPQFFVPHTWHSVLL